MENYIEIEQKIDQYLKNEKIEFSCCFLGGVNEREIEETEKALNVILPNSYKFFLKKYGSGGIEGMTFWGIEANKKQVEEYTVVAITEEYRKNGLPHNLIVVEENGDYVTCLETDKMNKDKECPVVTWSCYDEDEIVPLEKDFYTYLLNRIEDYI